MQSMASELQNVFFSVSVLVYFYNLVVCQDKEVEKTNAALYIVRTLQYN
jgi:hypothetical protein